MAAALVLAGLPSGCGTREAPDAAPGLRAIRLEDGRSVHVPVRPQRIVVANTALVDGVVALVEPARVAAICSQAFTWSTLAADPGPWADLPGFHEFTAEATLAARPDLVLASPFSRPETIATLRRAGLPVIRLTDPTTVDAVLARLALLGELLDARPAAAALDASIRARLADLAARSAARAQRPGALVYTFSGSEGWSSGAGTLQHAALELAGLDNVVAGRGVDGPRRLDFEALRGLDPEVLVVPAAFGEVDGSTARMLRTHPALAGLRAVAADRIVEIPPALFSTTSHEIVTTAETIAAAIDGMDLGR